VLDMAEGVFSGKRGRQAVSDRIHSFEVDWSPSLQAPTHRVRPIRLYAYDADGWPLKLHGHGDTRDEPTTSDRNHNHVRVRHLLEELEAHRPLAAHDREVIEGMDQCEIPFSLQGQTGVEHTSLRLHHLAAVALRRLNLRWHGGGRHHDGGPGSHGSGAIGQGCGVVSRRHRHQPARQVTLAHRKELVEHPAWLERSRLLEKLRLEVQTHAQLIGQGGHLHRRGDMHPSVDPGPCLLDIFEFKQYTRPPIRHALTLTAGSTQPGWCATGWLGQCCGLLEQFIPVGTPPTSVRPVSGRYLI
jgi:hypothetical protein